MMKFEDFLVQPSKMQRRRIALEEEVEELQERLNGELKLNSFLQNALRGPVLSYPSLSSLLPLKVQMLLAELALVEKEITCLETRLEKLKVSLYRGKKLNKEWEVMQPKKHLQVQVPCRQKNQGEQLNLEWLSTSRSHHHNRRKTFEEGRLSLSSTSDIHVCSSARFKEETENRSQRFTENKQSTAINAEDCSEEPNRLSEELLKCFISIFLKMKQRSSEGEGQTAPIKHTLNCIKSKGFSPKTTFSCKARSSYTSDYGTSINPYGILPDSDSIVNDFSTYKSFIQITGSSLKTACISDSYLVTGKLRVLLQKLCYVDLTPLTYKQKLAFWINIYNACIMHVLLAYDMGCHPHRKNC